MAVGFTLPDKGEGASNIQSIPFQEYLEVLVAGATGIDCVLSGGLVTTSALLTVAIAKAGVMTNGVLKAVAATTKAVGTADATNPRIDLIVVDSAGAVQVRAGTAAANPKPPNRTANDVVLANIYVPALLTTVVAGDITDMRVFARDPIILKKTTTAVAFDTTNAIQTYFTITLPDGLFLAGKAIRVRCGGNYKSTLGSRVNTLTLAYGGTTMFADALAATAADADLGAWDLDFILNASGDATQTLEGTLHFQTPGAKTAPTTGTAGDLAVVTHVAAPVRGTASVNSDTGDRTLTVQWTMSVSSINEVTTMDFGSAELL